MSIRALPIILVVLLPFGSLEAAAQTSGAPRELDRYSLQLAAGPLLMSSGNTLSAGFGVSPISRLDLLVTVERDHLPFEREAYADGFGATRGGTLTAVSGELRAALFPPHRASPYAFAGIGAGKSRPTVNAMFPTPIENDLRTVYFGGGVRVPVRRRLSIFGDARVMLALEGDDSLLGVWPRPIPNPLRSRRASGRCRPPAVRGAKKHTAGMRANSGLASWRGSGV